MDAIAKNDLEVLTADHSPPCVSIYTPTHPAGREGEKDPLRLDHLVDEAEQQLTKVARRSVEVREFLTPLRELAADDAFWSDRSAGLAVFLSGDLSRRFRLPLTFEPHVFVGTRFVVRPLLPLLVQDDRFLVLTLSQHRVRLLEGSRFLLIPRDTPGLPAKMDEGVIATDQGRKQMHIGGSDPTHRHSAIYHGHGGKPDARKDQIEGFFRAVDAALHPVLRDERAPLIIAGVGSVLALYREVNSHARLAELQLEANCDRLTEPELHRRVWPVMQEILANDRKRQTRETYAAADPAQCVRDVRVIVPAADHGQVELLLAASDACLYGSYDASQGEGGVQIDCQPKDDLVDIAAAHTLRHRGKVFVVDREEIPGCANLAAVLRK